MPMDNLLVGCQYAKRNLGINAAIPYKATTF